MLSLAYPFKVKLKKLIQMKIMNKINFFMSVTTTFDVVLLATKCYINRLGIKYLFNLFCYSLLFRIIIALFSLTCFYFSLFSLEQINVIIPCIIIGIYLLRIFKGSKHNIKLAFYNIVTLILTLFVVFIMWFVFGLLFSLIISSIDLLGDYLLLMGDKDPSLGESSKGGTGTGGDGEGGKPPKPSKPNLQIKIGPQSDAEKDLQKVGYCSHESHFPFDVTTDEEVESTLCDYPTEQDSKGKPILHRAFDYVGDKALVCNDCHAIICKNCYEEHSSEDSPVSDNWNDDNNKNIK